MPRFAVLLVMVVLAAVFGLALPAGASAATCAHTELQDQWVDPNFTGTGHGGTGFTTGDFQCDVSYRVIAETQESTTSQTSGFSQISNVIYYPNPTGHWGANVERIITSSGGNFITYWDEGDWNSGMDPDPMCSGTKWFRTKAVFRDEDHGNVLITTSFSTAVTC